MALNLPPNLLLFALALFALSFFQMITKPNETDDNNSAAIALHPGLPQPAVASWVGGLHACQGQSCCCNLKFVLFNMQLYLQIFLYLHTYTCANACILSACQGQPGQPALLYICIYDLFFIYFTETFPAVSIHIF